MSSATIDGPAVEPKASETAAASSPRASRKRLVLVAGAVLLLGVLLAVLAICGWLPFHHAAGDKHPGVAAAASPLYVEMPEIVTNLDAGPHRLSFVKMQCRVEIHRAQDQAAVTAAMPRLVDMLETYLRVLRPEELRSNIGMFRLHESLLARAVIAVPNAQIDDILFAEMIVQ